MIQSISVSALLLLVLNPFAQKSGTVFGDAWTGAVQTVNETTREITIQFSNKDQTETFTGVLREGYRMTDQDGSLYVLKLSDIPIGMRVRLFAKRTEANVGGQKIKRYEIWRIQFLGHDEYAHLRTALNLDQSTSVVLQEKRKLPLTNPLKMHVLIYDDTIKERFLAWIAEWNTEKGPKSGRIEINSTFGDSDASLVVLRADVLIDPFLMDAEGRTHRFASVSAFLVIKTERGLEVLWKDRLLTSAEISTSAKGRLEKEIEKRVKARSQ